MTLDMLHGTLEACAPMPISKEQCAKFFARLDGSGSGTVCYQARFGSVRFGSVTPRRCIGDRPQPVDWGSLRRELRGGRRNDRRENTHTNHKAATRIRRRYQARGACDTDATSSRGAPPPSRVTKSERRAAPAWHPSSSVTKSERRATASSHGRASRRPRGARVSGLVWRATPVQHNTSTVKRRRAATPDSGRRGWARRVVASL